MCGEFPNRLLVLNATLSNRPGSAASTLHDRLPPTKPTMTAKTPTRNAWAEFDCNFMLASTDETQRPDTTMATNRRSMLDYWNPAEWAIFTARYLRLHRLETRADDQFRPGGLLNVL